MIGSTGSIPFDVTVEQRGTATILIVHGDIDLATAPHLSRAIEGVVSVAGDEPGSVIIDLGDVLFLASAGMSVLVKASQVTGTSAFAVVADGPTTARPLTLMGLDQVFAVYPDLDSALAGIRTA